jgi:hypothetical protein
MRATTTFAGWRCAGSKARGKSKSTGDMDNYYLNNAVHLTEPFLKSTTGQLEVLT